MSRPRPDLDCRDHIWQTSGAWRHGAPRPSTRCNWCEGPLPVDPCTPDDALLPVCDECCPECNPEGTR